MRNISKLEHLGFTRQVIDSLKTRIKKAFKPIDDKKNLVMSALRRWHHPAELFRPQISNSPLSRDTWVVLGASQHTHHYYKHGDEVYAHNWNEAWQGENPYATTAQTPGQKLAEEIAEKESKQLDPGWGFTIMLRPVIGSRYRLEKWQPFDERQQPTVKDNEIAAFFKNGSADWHAHLPLTREQGAALARKVEHDLQYLVNATHHIDENDRSWIALVKKYRLK